MSSWSAFWHTYKAFMKKEWLEAIRSYRILIIAVGILFFGIADPILFKLMPDILKSQVPGLDPSKLMDLSQVGALHSHIKNLFQISTLILVIALMGILPGERQEKTLAMPLSSGASLSAVYLAKWSFYVLFIGGLTLVDLWVCTQYSGLLLKSSVIGYDVILKTAFVIGGYFTCVLTGLMLLGAWLKRSTVAGILTLVVFYGSGALGALWSKAGVWLPQQLITEANALTGQLSGQTLETGVVLVGVNLLLMGVTILLMKGTEWV